ncbi:germination protein YpeB [Bacillaceae bacterium S4-13-58]
MIRGITIGVLAVGIMGSAFWGYQEHQEKNAILIQAENTYQRAFHDLSYHLDLLHDKIGTTLAMNSDSQLSPQLAEVWRLTSEAHADVGQLPLTLIPFNETEEFLASIGEFSYRAAIRNLEKEPLTDEETETLKTLYEQSGEIKNEMRKVQAMVIKNDLRWMDVQLALATQDEKADNTIIDGFKTVEKNVKGYTEGNYGPTFTSVSSDNHEYKYITGSEITEEEALKKAKELFTVEMEMDISESGEGADIPMYSISYDIDDRHGYMDLSKKGGHVLSLIINREISEPKLSLYDGGEKAKEFVDQFEYPEELEIFQSSQYGNTGVYQLIGKQDDVKIYPDSVQIKVALDDGEVIGISARDFLMNYQKREINTEDIISSEEARDKVNSNVKIQEESLAVINNDLGKEVLCYEFLGILGNDTYRVFVNANNGMEEMVEKMEQVEADLSAL